MNSKLGKYLGLILTAVAAALFLYSFYPKILSQPNDYLMSIEGDGIKNYFAFADHIKNDSSLHHLRNMNYPYGQVHTFTDGQPALSNTLKLLSRWNGFFQEQSIGIFHVFVFASFVFCAIFIYLILLHLKVEWWIAALGGFSAMVMSPQIFRLSGHISLAYSAAFPLVWWLFLKFRKSKNKWLLSLWLVAVTVLLFFLHPYLGMIAAFFLILSWMIEFITEKTPFTWKNLSLASFQSLLPIVIYKSYTLIVDHHFPRGKHPWGFWKYHANWESVFIPNHPPLRSFYEGIFNFSVLPKWEAWSYVGLIGGICTIFLISQVITLVFKRKSGSIIFGSIPSGLITGLIAGSLMLLFSMAIPFKWNMQFLVEDWFPILKQFRSLGRFSWAFYFVIVVTSFYLLLLLFQYSKKHGKAYYGAIPIIMAFAVFTWEGIPHHCEMAKKTQGHPNLFQAKNLTEDEVRVVDFIKSVKDEYQCFIPLPLFYVGTEDFCTKGDSMIKPTLLFSYHSDFPTMASSAARSPIEEGKRILQFFSPPFFEKKIQEDLPNDKPFLFLYSGEEIGKQQRYYLNKAQKVFESGKYQLFHLPFDVVFQPNRIASAEKFQLDTMQYYQSRFWTSEPADTIILLQYEDCQNKIYYRGKKALSGRRLEFNPLLIRQKLTLEEGKKYNASVWFYNKGELRPQIGLTLEVGEDPNGKGSHWTSGDVAAHSMIIDGDWSMLELEFTAGPDSLWTKFFMKSFDGHDMPVYFDDFLLRPADVDVFWMDTIKGKRHLVKNNITLPHVIN